MKFNIIFYNDIINLALIDFFQKHGELFIKDLDDFVLAAGKFDSLKKSFSNCIDENVNRLHEKYDGYIVILNSCQPIDNILLNLDGMAAFPKKLQKLITGKPTLKWLLLESDIKIDIAFFNEIANDIFLKKSQTSDEKMIFLQHRNLDEYQLFKIVKWMFGNCNCTNISKEERLEENIHIISINKLIARYSRCKRALNKSKELKLYANEIKTYLESKLSIQV